MAENTAGHWDRLYESAPTHEFGWYEPSPSTLGLVTANSTPADSVIDVGGGDSRLVDELIKRGYHDLTVLDVSKSVLDTARQRLGGLGNRVEWINADLRKWHPQRTWDLWHDRAVFHFLIDEDEVRAYQASLSRALAPDGRVVVATLSPEAPDMCAGLPVSRYDGAALTEAFAPDFEPISVGPIERSQSPEGDQRPYVGAVLRRSP